MTLRVPVSKIATVGMRKLAEGGLVKRALETLKGRARIKRTMWSRRAQEYEAKINSGDIVAIAEVVRDLFRSDTQPEQSYSERQLYEAALDRLSRKISEGQEEPAPGVDSIPKDNAPGVSSIPALAGRLARRDVEAIVEVGGADPEHQRGEGLLVIMPRGLIPHIVRHAVAIAQPRLGFGE